MSSTTRTAAKGGKSAKGDSSKSHKHDKSDTGKGSNDKQHGGGENARSKNDDPGIKEKVRQVIEMTRRSEEEVCLALHECDYDAERAINMLFENMVEGEWETSSKKKKNRQASTSKIESEEAAPVDEWNESPELPNDKEKPRNKSGGGPPRLHGRHNDSRGWRGRENKENERNLDDANQEDRKERRGRGGHVRGGTGGRGRGGGRAGSRYPPRNNRNNFNNARPIDTWDNSIPWESTTITNSSHTNYPGKENWDEFPPADDWSTEEYTGSLADTKVFTPSMAMASDADPGLEQANVMPTMTIEAMPPPIVGTLSAAQTQYLNQLTQQSNENIKAAQYASGHPSQPYDNTSQPYNTGQTYGNNNSTSTAQYNNNAQYGSSPSSNTFGTNYVVANSNYSTTTDTQAQPQHHPVRTKTQRARVPPPSKIPASAVEMPGDINSSIGYLDVQFGGMDFMSDGSTFDGVADNKFSPTNDTNLSSSIQTPNSNIDLSQTVPNPPLDVYSSKTNTQQSSITTALSQNLTNTDGIPPSNEHLSGTYSSLPRSSTVAANATQTITPTGLDLNKQSEKHSYSQSSYNSYQPKTTTYQNQNYSSSNYSTPQTTSNSYANSNTPSYNTPSTGNAYQNSYSSVSSYQTNSNSSTFPTISQANSYPANNQYHQQTSQSVYGANSAGLNSNSSYGNTPSGSQYSSYNASSNKLVKDSNYDGTATSVSSTTTATSSINTSTLTQTTATGTKSTTALAKNTSNNVMSNIPPAGVTPVMSAQYIMGQVPYFQQPIYSFEEMQLLQQRIPHMTGYYDMSYQTPTTLAAVRDGTLANVAYSISDGRFTRGDNNTSPVPSTLSQQTSTLTQGHQAQPMLAAQTGAAPFFYAPYNPMQPTYQFPAVYPQMPTVTNTHGSNNSQYPKPGTYGSGYGSGYDPLTQTQDYSKGGYVSNTQGQSKGSGGNASTGGSSGNDLTAMYGKSHTALGKVNSYDKQGFHSGTPPPFTGTLHGNQSTGLAPSGTSYNPMFISTLPPQQHHSTPLIHQQIHQMEVRQQGRRMDSSSSGQRSQASSQAKSGAKQSYPASYWNQA